MKFLCSNCKAKYQISDDKVAGRTLRMTCRKCKEEIVIRGDMAPKPAGLASSAPSSSPRLAPSASALSADWEARLMAPPIPQLDSAPNEEWHIAINDIPVGPMRREEVARKIAGGAVGPASLAWREGLDDWVPLSQIPELALLLPGRGSVAPPQGPPRIAPPSPAQRVDALPLGGRAGAGTFSSEEWSLPPPDTSPSQVGRNPSLEAPLPTPRGGMPTAGLMFAVLGFALLMTVVAIVGAGWLRTSESKTAAVQEQAPAEEPAKVAREAVVETELPDEEARGEEIEEMVIELDSLEPERDKKPSKARSPKPSKADGKQLTAEQRAMLERMGGSGADLSNLRTRDSDARGGGRAGKGDLTASQLSQVVVRGKQNLQRCYETAARSTGRGETVRMDVSLTVSPSGNVTKVNAAGQGLPGMDRCIERTVRMWRFPSSAEGAQTKFPLVFSPGG